MSKEERHLQTKIRMFEDILLRTKNPSQVLKMYQISLSKTLVLSFVISEEKNQSIIARETGTSVSSSKIRSRQRNFPMMDGM